MRCRTAGEMTDSVLEFVRAGVDAGEAVLVGSAGPVLQRLRILLGSHGEHVSWTGMASATTNPMRIIAALRAFADEHPGQPTRCVLEPAWHLLPAHHLCEAIRQDALVNLALAGCQATVLCAFESQLGGDAAATAERTHPLTYDGAGWLPSPQFAGQEAIPRECQPPLPEPPPWAPSLPYRANQAAVRRFAGDHARAYGLGPDQVTDLVIAVGELTANTLAHTSGPGMLRVWRAGPEVLCQVDDSGQIGDPLAGSFLPHLSVPGGGRGLWVVHHLCDLVEVRTGTGGTAFRLHMRVAPADDGRRRGRSGSPACRA
jgi:anti-sigma regulatory factor (Ser/Thr protein kinase)